MKTCNKCLEEKSLDQFAWRSKAKGTKQSYCSPCKKDMDAANYSSNEQRRLSTAATQIELRNRNLTYMRDYLREHPCVDCGESDIRVLDFDHLKDKVDNVTNLARLPCSIERLKDEIDKCEVRCANHHRIKTYERAGWKY